MPPPNQVRCLILREVCDDSENFVQIIIQVGGNSSSPGGVQQFLSTTQFEPNLVLATNGTIVTFKFTGRCVSFPLSYMRTVKLNEPMWIYSPGNHSVTQSSFANPCQPLDGGFDSGWISVKEALPSPPEWNLTITNDRIRARHSSRSLSIH
jgi:hypothetical protein